MLKPSIISTSLSKLSKLLVKSSIIYSNSNNITIKGYNF